MCCFVGKLRKLRNFDTQAGTLGEPFDLAQATNLGELT